MTGFSPHPPVSLIYVTSLFSRSPNAIPDYAPVLIAGDLNASILSLLARTRPR
jgi:hypothetical protein